MEGYSRFHIPALFCSDFFSAGFTLVPNLILKYGSRLNLSSTDLLVLLACFYFQQQGTNEVNCKDFARLLNMTEKSVKASIEAMSARGIFVVSGNTCELCGLFEKITDLWAEEKMQAIQDANQEAATTSRKAPLAEMRSPHFHNLLQTFEQEFGRALSQIECATILNWYKDKGYSESVILEALKRAVLRGVLNLAYIDRILIQWSKKNLRTAEEVNRHEEQFMTSRLMNRDKGNQPCREARIKDKEEKYKDIYMS